MSKVRSEIGLGLYGRAGFCQAADGASEHEEAPEPIEAGGQVFPSQWHVDRYVFDLRRSLVEAETARSEQGAAG